MMFTTVTPADAKFAAERDNLVLAAIQQGWQVAQNDRHIKFVAPTGQITFMASQSVPAFATATIIHMKARLSRAGLSL